MSFLPEGYKAPTASGYYMKLVDGENRIRIMSKPVVGWEDWKDNKPIRFAMDKKPAKPIDPKKPVKHFWAMVVFNYNEEQIQVYQINQATIRKSIEALSNDADWGAPYCYDIKIMKTGDGVDTEYAVNPVPHKPIDPYLVTCFNERPCNLNALFDGADPFSPEWATDQQTKLADSDGDHIPDAGKKVIPFEKEVEFVTQEQVSKLTALFAELPQKFKTNVDDFMEKNNIATYKDMPMHTYDRVLKQALVEKARIAAGKK